MDMGFDGLIEQGGLDKLIEGTQKLVFPMQRHEAQSLFKAGQSRRGARCTMAAIDASSFQRGGRRRSDVAAAKCTVAVGALEALAGGCCRALAAG